MMLVDDGDAECQTIIIVLVSESKREIRSLHSLPPTVWSESLNTMMKVSDHHIV